MLLLLIFASLNVIGFKCFELHIAICLYTVMFHQMRHIVALKRSFFFSVLRIVFGKDEPLQSIKVALARQQSFSHLQRVLNQVSLLIISAKEAHHTSAEIVRLEIALIVSNREQV